MNLRKAIDKAKNNGTVGNGEPRPLIEELEKEQNIQTGLRPPLYTESRCFDPNPGLLNKKRCICMKDACPEVDAYKVLRTKISHIAAANNWKTMLITSSRPFEGKTLTAVNLAISFSKAHDQTVLLVDCDLRKQSVHTLFGVDSGFGLMDHLEDKVPLKKLIVCPGIEKLTFISGGKWKIRNGAENLASAKMKQLVEELKSRYSDRYVLFDTPPILGYADTLSLTPFVDCILMVVDHGKTSMNDVEKALEVIPREKFLGFVFNRQKSGWNRNGKHGYY